MIRRVLEAINEQDQELASIESFLRSRGWTPGPYRGRWNKVVDMRSYSIVSAVFREWTGPIERMKVEIWELGQPMPGGGTEPFDDEDIRQLASIRVLVDVRPMQDGLQGFHHKSELSAEQREYLDGFGGDTARIIPFAPTVNALSKAIQELKREFNLKYVGKRT